MKKLLLISLVLFGSTSTINAQWSVNSGSTPKTVHLDSSSYSAAVGASNPAGKFRVETTAADPSTTSTVNGFLNLTSTSLANSFGVASNYSWIQSRDYESSTMRTLALNPLGGNVAVGHTTPTRTLDVSGNVNIRNTIAGNRALTITTTTTETVTTSGALITDSVTLGAVVNHTGLNTVLHLAGTQTFTNTSNALSGTFVNVSNDATGGSIETLHGSFIVMSNTNAGSVTNMCGMRIGGATKTGSGAVTNFYGVRITPQTIASTLVAGFASEITSAAGRYNLYISGSANNYLAGKLGIGTTSPSSSLSLSGDAAQTIGMELNSVGGSAGANLTIQAGGASASATNGNGGDLKLNSGIATGTGTSNLRLYTVTAGNLTPTEKMTILGSGSVGIGTTTPFYTLDVCGDIRASGSVFYGGTCGSNAGTAYTKPDYVFETGYKLYTPAEVEKFISKKGHLPWLTSAKKELKENNGAVNITRMSFETLEAVENLTLQIIEQQKIIDKQDSEMQEQHKLMAELQSRMKALEKQ